MACVQGYSFGSEGFEQFANSRPFIEFMPFDEAIEPFGVVFARHRGVGSCGLTFELSGPEPGWRLAREADAKPGRLAGQVPGRWRSARAKG